MLALRERLERGLAALPAVRLFGTGAPRLPNTVQLAWPGIDGEALLMALDRQGYAVSTGSACKRGKPSHVLAAMGVPEELARGALRLSLGKDSTMTEVDGLLAALATITGALPRVARA
jgi:cysteine desulfurase